MRVVIADDERYVRLVLKDTLTHINIPIEVVGEADDGEKAYELCRECLPDLLITDIRMPSEDGLSLLNRIRQEFPKLPVIIYSGYDNFSYAQKAIHYGVEEYLLKPIDEEILEESIKRIMENRKGEKQKEKEFKNAILYSMLYEKESKKVVEGALNYTKFSKDEKEFLNTIQGFYLSFFAVQAPDMIEEEVWQEFFRHSSVYGWYLDEKRGMLFVLCEEEEKERICAQLKELWGQEVSWLQSYRLCTKELEMHKRFRELQEKRNEVEQYRCAFFWGGGSTKNTTVTEKKVRKRDGELYNQKYLSQIIAAVKLLKKDYLEEVIDKYVKGLTEEFYGENPEFVKEIIKNFIGKEILSLELPIEDCEKIALSRKEFSWALEMKQVSYILEKCQKLILELYRKQNEKDATECTKEMIEDYMAENYSQDVTLEQLAEYLHFNVNYTSSLFKRIFGKTFISYLTDIRMERAKELLSSSNFKVYEIARQIGYDDEHYFQRVFKKTTKVTPKEYKKMHAGK